MRVALVSIGRLENCYAEEWVQHHLQAGFDHIFIADNNHDGEERFEDVLEEYIRNGKVSVMNWRGKVAVQKEAYNNIYSKHSHEYDWFAFLDFDEFLDVRRGTLKGMLKGRKAKCILINWQCYGDNGLTRFYDKPCWERFSEPLPHPLFVQYANHAENEHVESIVRGGLAKMSFTHNPHVPDIGSESGYETASGEKCPPSAFHGFEDSVAVLRHYITKTAEEWVWRSRRGSGSRSLTKWRKDYAGRFWKYNERTKEKERIMNGDKTVAIVHYNTPELVEAAILSIRKHGGEDYKIVIFDNSDEKPWKKRFKGVSRIDNTQGQIVNFEKELAKFKNKWPRHAVNGKCVYGSDKHMMSVQALFDLIPEGFLLMDSDVLLKQSVDFMFQPEQCVVGHIQTWDKTRNPYKIERLVPMLCYINVPLCKDCKIRYWDEKRSWMLHGDTKASWYDTGASFLEDIRSHKNGAHGKRIDIRPLMEHLKSGSWKNQSAAKAWLKKNESLWKVEKAGKPATAKRANSKGK